MLDDFTQFVKYFEKSFSGVKPILAAIISLFGYILFPDKFYYTAVLTVTAAALCDIVTKWWSICRINGGYVKAVTNHKLQSKSLWDGTRVKIFSYLIVMILTGLSYRVVYLEQAGIFMASFVYVVLFFRECQSNLENLISGGAKLQWLLLFTKQKQKEMMKPYENPTEQLEAKRTEEYDGRV